jgi:hypothetical protein
MEQQHVSNDRKQLIAKMTAVFGDKIQLSKELQKTLLDDMVTAFESRLAVLYRAQKDM